MRLTVGNMLDPRLKSLLHSMRISILPILQGIERQHRKAAFGVCKGQSAGSERQSWKLHKKGGGRLKADQHPAHPAGQHRKVLVGLVRDSRHDLKGSFWVCKGQLARAEKQSWQLYKQRDRWTDRQAGRQGHDSRSHSQRTRLELDNTPKSFMRHACHICQALEHQHEIPYGPDSQRHASDDELGVV